MGFGMHPVWRKRQFFSIFLGVNLTFFPQHFLGMGGIPRRYPDYTTSFSVLNAVSRLGSTASIFRLFYFLFILWSAILCQNCVLFVFCTPRDSEWRLLGFPPK